MSERVYVELTVLDAQAKACKVFFANEEWDDTETVSTNGLTSFSFHEVSYGELDFLPELLARGIAYESSWCAGDEYTEGTEYCRFYKDSTATTIQVYNDEINPHLPTLMSLLSTPYELINFIELHYKRVTPPSWDNQIEYGKLYQIQQLLLGNTI